MVRGTEAVLEIPEGFEKVEATVYRKGDELILVLPDEMAIGLKIVAPPQPEDFGPPPAGFEWTGEDRPPKKGELFWSDIRGRVVEAVEDETGVNQFGEPTGGRKILHPVAKPAKPERTRLRLVKDDE